MASKMLSRVFSTNILQKFRLFETLKNSNYMYYSSSVSDDISEVKYPPVKPKYPSGAWGNMPPENAWTWHEKAVQLNALPKVKERLEDLAGLLKDPQTLWKVNPLDAFPETLLYKQYITKTHVINGMPDIYERKCKDLDPLCEKLKPLICEALLQDQDTASTLKSNPKHSSNAHSTIRRVVDVLFRLLSSDREYLLKSQLDENVHLESFWWRCGYEKEEEEVKGMVEDSMLKFKLKHMSSFQLRCEQPLPEIVPHGDSLCQGDYPKFNYAPNTLSQEHQESRPINISGHWIGDPCEFCMLSVHVLGEEYDRFVQEHGRELAEEETVSYALMTAFTSAVAQAHNQGFNLYWDVNQPFTTQAVVTDGHKFRFCTYQLNTLHLWQDDDSNPHRNLMWVTDMLPLYETIVNNTVIGFNDEVLRRLVRMVLLEPEPRTLSMRPYLSEDESPLSQNKYINHVGEEPIEERVVGRFEYPANSVYFS